MTQQLSRTILVVEDDAAIRDALTQILEDEGYRVDGAANGREALAYLQSQPAPCLILLDLMMPVMNGWQFRSEQRADPALAAIPVVVLSADGGVQQKAEAIDAIGYFKKPLALAPLLDLIEQLCP